jgi:hypothetical protein
MTTLRRELRTKFEGILQAFEDKLSIAERESTAELLADAALEVRGIAKIEEKTKPDILDGILAYSHPHDEMDSLHDFERTFGFGALPWYSNTVWDKFAKWIIKQAGAGWFADYVQWRNGDGKYKAFSNKKIRENPAAFMDTGYPEYEASKMYRKTDEARPEYQAVEQIDTSDAIPNPHRKPIL